MRRGTRLMRPPQRPHAGPSSPHPQLVAAQPVDAAQQHRHHRRQALRQVARLSRVAAVKGDCFSILPVVQCVARCQWHAGIDASTGAARMHRACVQAGMSMPAACRPHGGGRSMQHAGRGNQQRTHLRRTRAKRRSASSLSTCMHQDTMQLCVHAMQCKPAASNITRQWRPACCPCCLCAVRVVARAATARGRKHTCCCRRVRGRPKTAAVPNVPAKA